MFSKACEYGIKSMIYIAQQDAEGRVGLKEISEATKSPLAFTAKILQILTRDGLLVSLKGPTGGFSLSKDADDISLASIVSAIDGDQIYTGCGLGLESCSEIKPCPLHFKFAKVRGQLSEMLHTTRLREMADGLASGKVLLSI